MKDILVVGVSLLGSAIINIGGIWYQFKVVKPDAKREQKINEWYLDTAAIARNLRRRSIRIPPGYSINPENMEPADEDSPVDFTELKIGIKNLCELRDEAPASIPDEITDKIDNIEYWFNSAAPKPANLQSHDVQEIISKRTQQLVDLLAENHEEIEAGSY